MEFNDGVPREAPTVYEDPPVDQLPGLTSDIWFMIRAIKDPEFPYTLSQLRVVHPDNLYVDERLQTIKVLFRPTVQHCSLATLIGLAIHFKLQIHFGPQWRITVGVYPDSHEDLEEIEKQLQDKERVSAAFENPTILQTIEDMTSDDC